MVSHNGTVGHTVRKVQEFVSPWQAGSLLVMHSDGLATQWQLDDSPGLAVRAAGVVAGDLYRDFRRGRDDVTVVAVREPSESEKQYVTAERRRQGNAIGQDNTGYDLRNLFIGAEGTLGIITAATLKLFPKPRAVETGYVGLKSPAEALKLLSIARSEAANSLTSFELLADIAVDFSLRHGIDIRDPLTSKHPWYVLMELSSSRDDARDALESILARGMEEGIVDDAVIAANLSQRAGFWKLRDEMSAAQKPEGGSIKHDISVPVAAVPDFIEEANAAVVKLIPGARPVPFGHLGDGNIHYNVSQPVGGNTADFMSRWHEVNEVVFAIVLRMGGSISAEHGIGVLKRDELPEVKDKVAIELMRGIKAMLDPKGIMNPGKVL